MDDGRKQATAHAEADARQDQAGDEGPDDADHDIAQHAKAVAFNDAPRQPPGNGTDELPPEIRTVTEATI